MMSSFTKIFFCLKYWPFAIRCGIEIDEYTHVNLFVVTIYPSAF